MLLRKWNHDLQIITRECGSFNFNQNATDEHIQLFLSHYDIYNDIRQAENLSGANATAADIVETPYKNDLHGLLSVLSRIAELLATPTSTSYSTEYYLNDPNGMKAYLRSTMDQMHKLYGITEYQTDI